jgi:hypothetical protein
MPGPSLIGRVALAAMAALGIPATAEAQQKTPTEQELKAKGARQMVGAEISASRVGNTWYYLFLAGGSVLAVYYRDERNRLAMFQGRKRHTLWWMEGDRFCDEAVGVVGHSCGKIYVLNNQMHYCLDGRPNCGSIVRQLPGNPEKL